MKVILVGVKRVIDPYIKIRVQQDNLGVEMDNVKMVMNPFDEIALEEALRMREKGFAKEVVALSIGQDSSQETLRHALALGADRAILVKSDCHYESLNIAKIMKQIIVNEAIDLVFLGKQSIDGDNNQTPQMLAALLNWPQATFASKVEDKGDKLEVTREIDGGLETISITLPAVISVDLRLNEPRYATLPNIMRAKQKPLKIVDVNTLGLSLTPHKEVLAVKPPPTRQGGVFVDSIDALLEKLQHEAKVL